MPDLQARRERLIPGFSALSNSGQRTAALAWLNKHPEDLELFKPLFEQPSLAETLFNLPAADAPIYAWAQAYSAQGLSVIPLRKDKRPAVAWKEYQQRHATRVELLTWREKGLFEGGIGIVQGRVSGQFTADFDASKSHAHGMALLRFRGDCPDLADTLEIATPSGGRHFVYRLPDESQDLQSAHLAFGDLLANGSQRAAPPTVRKNGAYTVERSRPVRSISASDIERLARYLGAPEAAPVTVSAPTATPATRIRRAAGDVQARALEIYHTGSSRSSGAMTALCYLRDKGLAQGDSIVFVLRTAFIDEPPRGEHAHETPRSRDSQFNAIVANVWQRPARPVSPEIQAAQQARAKQKQSRFLPNTLRETLFSMKVRNGDPFDGASFARLYDAVVCLGYRAGDALPGVNALQKALRAAGVSIDRVKLRGWVGFHTGTRDELQGENQPTYDSDRETEKKPRRAEGAKRLLSPTEFAERLNHKPGSVTDAVTIEDCASNKTYREALHIALIERQAGTEGKPFARKMLARRLGVGKWTVSKYNRELQDADVIRVEANIEDTSITAANTDNLLPENSSEWGNRGVWLEDEDGRKYPAYRDMARLLLREQHDVLLRRYRPSTYSIVDKPQLDLVDYLPDGSIERN